MLSVAVAVGANEDPVAFIETVRSVLLQRGASIELLIKCCDDSLRKLVESISCDNESVCIKAVFHPDNGIYDAFNCCALMATGSHIMFLGCGDLLADVFVVSDVLRVIWDKPDINCYYGQVLIAERLGEVSSLFDNSLLMRSGIRYPWRNPCHSQGLIYDTNWLVGHPFRVDVGPLADLVHVYEHSVYQNLFWINRPISIFLRGGVSNRMTKRAVDQRLLGVLANCNNFTFAPFWRLVSPGVLYFRFWMQRALDILRLS